MEFKNIDQAIREFALDTKFEIKRITPVDTGALRDSIDFSINGRTVTFDMLDYGIFVDEGTRHIRARNFFGSTIDGNLEQFLEDLKEAFKKDIEVFVETNLI